MPIRPAIFIWHEAEVTDGDGVVQRLMVMVPHPRSRTRAMEQFEAGAEYTLAPVEARNRAFHNAYFAQINEAFKNLPEKVSARWDDVEHFRKWVLVEEGFYTEKEFTFEGRNAKGEAQRLAAFIRTEDDYARMWVTCVQEAPPIYKVIIRRAQSQDHASMKNDSFRASAEAVLAFASNLIGTPRSELRKNAGRSA